MEAALVAPAFKFVKEVITRIEKAPADRKLEVLIENKTPYDWMDCKVYMQYGVSESNEKKLPALVSNVPNGQALRLTFQGDSWHGINGIFSGTFVKDGKPLDVFVAFDVKDLRAKIFRCMLPEDRNNFDVKVAPHRVTPLTSIAAEHHLGNGIHLWDAGKRKLGGNVAAEAGYGLSFEAFMSPAINRCVLHVVCVLTPDLG